MDEFGIALTCAWLAACAVQDWRKREVSNGLILPAFGIGALLRLAGFGQGEMLWVGIAGVLLYLAWLKGWIGGADCKAGLALALLDLQMLAWAWIGLGVWYGLLRLAFRREEVHRLPGFVGFTVGAVLYLAWRVYGG